MKTFAYNCTFEHFLYKSITFFQKTTQFVMFIHTLSHITLYRYRNYNIILLLQFELLGIQ